MLNIACKFVPITNTDCLARYKLGQLTFIVKVIALCADALKQINKHTTLDIVVDQQFDCIIIETDLNIVFGVAQAKTQYAQLLGGLRVKGDLVNDETLKKLIKNTIGYEPKTFIWVKKDILVNNDLTEMTAIEDLSKALDVLEHNPHYKILANRLKQDAQDFYDLQMIRNTLKQK